MAKDKDKDKDAKGIEAVKRAGQKAWDIKHPPEDKDKDKDKDGK